MPFELDTPIESASSQQVRVALLTHDSVRRFLRIHLEYGYTDGEGTWVANKPPAGRVTQIVAEGETYDALRAANAALYEDVKQRIYTFLSGSGVLDDGTVV